MSNENREIMPGETMFEYLKRKKRFLLEKTVLARPSPNARTPLQERSLNETDCGQTRREEPQEKTRRDSRDCPTSRTPLRGKQEATTKRATAIEQGRRPMHRSFIQMISPLRSKSPARETEKSAGREVSVGVVRKDREGGVGRAGRENFTRKMVTEKMNLMRETIESQLKAGRSLKEKAHLLFLELKPFFRHVQNCGESGFERKTEQIKGKVRAMEAVFRQLNAQAPQATIDQFYMHFSQHLNQLDGQAKAGIEENRDALASEMATTKDREIYDLKDENARLEKEVAVMTRKYSKLERSYEELLEQTELRLSEKEAKYEEKIQKLEAQLMVYEQRNSDLGQEASAATVLNKKYQQQRKQLISQRQRFEQECLNTITRVKSEQEEFLLNEIVGLKKEFNVDISKMAELYRIKEEELLRKIKEGQAEVQRLQKIVEEVVESNKRLDEAMVAVQAQSIRIKKQNECLATDMHRINEELYQHWLALKDIKTLSQRLDIFSKFKKIYEELLFNEQLFL